MARAVIELARLIGENWVKCVFANCSEAMALTT